MARGRPKIEGTRAQERIDALEPPDPLTDERIALAAVARANRGSPEVASLLREMNTSDLMDLFVARSLSSPVTRAIESADERGSVVRQASLYELAEEVFARYADKYDLMPDRIRAVVEKRALELAEAEKAKWRAALGIHYAVIKEFLERVDLLPFDEILSVGIRAPDGSIRVVMLRDD